MKKVNLTPEFYEQLVNDVYDYCKRNYENEDGEKYVTMSVCLSIGDYEVELDAEVESEFVDESFDHAFGTWHDPMAGWAFGSVYDVNNVHVYDADGEVEGFSKDGFTLTEYKGFKAGDEVTIRYTQSGKVYKVVSYDLFSEQFCLTDGEKNVFHSLTFVKKAA